MDPPELSGHYLNDKVAIAKLFTDNYVNILPSENSLNFFVQCSEERLYRVRNGIRLRDAVETHQDIYETLVKQRKPARSNEEEHKKLKQAVILGLDHQRPRPGSGPSYFQLEEVRTAEGQASPGMQEYVKAKKFDAGIERKKHHFLPSYFYERYAKVSTLLNEKQRRDSSDTASPSALTGQQGTRKGNGKGMGRAETEDPFIAKIDEIDESIRKEVDEKANSRRREELLRQQKESYIASLIHSKKPKKTGTDFIDHRYLKLRALGRTVYTKPLAEVRPRILEFLEKAVFPDTPPTTPPVPLLASIKSSPFLYSQASWLPASAGSSTRDKVRTAKAESVRSEDLSKGAFHRGRSPLATPSGKIREIVARALSIERTL